MDSFNACSNCIHFHAIFFFFQSVSMVFLLCHFCAAADFRFLICYTIDARRNTNFFFLALIELHYDLQVAIRVTQTIFPLNPNNKANYLHITFLLASRHLDKNSTHYFASSNTFAKKNHSLSSIESRKLNEKKHFDVFSISIVHIRKCQIICGNSMGFHFRWWTEIQYFLR